MAAGSGVGTHQGCRPFPFVPRLRLPCLRVVFGCPCLRRSHPRSLVLSLGPARRAGWCRGTCCRCRGCRACQQRGWVAGRRHRGCRAHRRCGWPVVDVAGAGPLDDVACRRGGAASSTGCRNAVGGPSTRWGRVDEMGPHRQRGGGSSTWGFVDEAAVVFSCAVVLVLALAVLALVLVV